MKKISAIGFSLLLASSLMAADGYRYEIAPTVSKNWSDRNSGFESATSWGAKLNAYLNDIVGFQLAYDRLDNVHFRHGPQKSDIDRIGLNLLLEAPNSSHVTPYMLIGGGYEKVEVKLDDEDSQAFANVGAGFKYSINKALDAMIEARYIRKLDSYDSDVMGTFGLGYKFGYVAPPAPAPQPVVEPEPAPEPEPAVEQPKDSDHDGVTDDVDQCPNTAEGIKVDQVGCPVDLELVIHFDFDKAIIRDEDKPKIDKIIEILKKEPTYKAVVAGHTDSIGPASYNMKLSKRRAEALKAYMVAHGISPDRIKLEWYGETRPIASNATPEGRALNRRDEAKFSIRIQ
ncbi:MAG: OmpA family protein [Epsilonproteobacteria bacterium]|nr:OmpA family protein [Campylobacterota bacterium]